MSVVVWLQTTKIRKGSLVTKRGSDINARKKEANKVVRLASRRGSHSRRKRKI